MGIRGLADTFRPCTLSDVRILVVDDKDYLRAALSAYLSYSGFKMIHEAADGQDALDVLQREHVDLIISDFDMPRLNGLQLLQQVRQDEDLHNLPVIITSGTDGLGPRAIATGADAFITKGDDPKVMMGIVMRLAEAAVVKEPEAQDFHAQNDLNFDPRI